MTQLLIRAFVKDHQNRQDPAVRERYGRLAGIVGVVCNLLLFAGKVTVGTLFGSIAITADAVNNLSDASSSVVSLVGFKLAAKAPDAEHPYGHARYEYVAGLAVSTMTQGCHAVFPLHKAVNKCFIQFQLLAHSRSSIPKQFTFGSNSRHQ